MPFENKALLTIQGFSRFFNLCDHTMPIYAYQCGACGFAKDQLQKITDPALTDCPQCGKSTLTKLLTAPGFQLKGSGWYATDFKNGSAAPATSTQDSTTQTPSAPGGETSPSPAPAATTQARAPSCACH